MKKLNTKEIIRKAAEFIQLYSQCKISDLEGFKSLFSGKTSASQYGYIRWTDDLIKKRNDFVGIISKRLGTKEGSEKDLLNNIEKFSQKLLGTEFEANDKAKELLKFIENECGKVSTFLSPNYLFKFSDNVTEINIGPVRIIATDKYAKEFSEKAVGHRVRFSTGKEFETHFHNGKDVEIISTPISILVETVASPANIKEEAIWLVDIATSLLRLNINEPSGYFPTFGKSEPKPNEYDDGKTKFSKIDEKFLVSIGGWARPTEYVISDKTKNLTETNEFKRIADAVFGAKDNSLAQRVANGLGWLTRGRQSHDRSTRLLYFFTALEALLTNDDKSSPIVQTIARHAAVLFSNDNKQRIIVAKEIRNLYSKRSALIHGGSRQVHQSDANKIQYYAELTFKIVLSECDISITHQNFNDALSEASYGLKWPQAE